MFISVGRASRGGSVGSTAGGSIVSSEKLTSSANPDSLAEVGQKRRYVFERVDRILQQYQPAAVMHSAAQSHVDRSISGSTEFIQTNFIGAYTLLEAGWGVGARKVAVAFITWCWVIRSAAVDSSRLA
ncbi:GDP-mannose 4,6-dehydratase [Pseudomonas umsongensis]|uniref:GDP-mannose 4,6-dehydratase n=1 Tax=Pseudomonas umsongensis TaxID=198618 RepID=UPI00384E6604